MDKFNLKKFATGNNVTVVELKDGDFIYIQIPKPENMSVTELKEIRSKAHDFFDWAFKDMNVKHTVDFAPLQFTVITKKEEFVARLNDDIVQL